MACFSLKPSVLQHAKLLGTHSGRRGLSRLSLLPAQCSSPCARRGLRCCRASGSMDVEEQWWERLPAALWECGEQSCGNGNGLPAQGWEASALLPSELL